MVFCLRVKTDNEKPNHPLRRTALRAIADLHRWCKSLPGYVSFLLVVELEAWADGTNTSTIAQQVDRWFHYLADGSREQQREAITNLSPDNFRWPRDRWTNSTREIWAAVRQYPFDVIRHENGSQSLQENRQRCELLLRAFPHLIEAIKGDSNSPADTNPLKCPAGSLLFHIQGMGPSAQDYEAWHQGWELHGRERFEQHLAAVADSITNTTPAAAIIERLFHQVADGSRAEQEKAIIHLWVIRKEGPSDPNLWDQHPRDPERRAMRVRAIENMIDALSTDLQMKANYILISIQESCPPPDQFRRAWETIGREEFLRRCGVGVKSP